MSVIVLNDAQRDAVYAKDPVLCCAVPGSGKTRVLVERTEYLLESEPNARILLTTFSRDAAREMQKRIVKRCKPSAAKRVLLGNFHSLSLRQLKAHQFDANILSAVETDHLIRTALSRTDSKIAVGAAAEIIARCKMDPSVGQEDKDAAKLTQMYEAMMAERGACDFTDILLRCVAYMKEGQVKPLEANHILCDEFQDIDRVQFEWLSLHLPQGAVPCAVGDDDQSIYGFRRALGYQGMMDFQAMTGARIITLDTNYRSTAGIVDAATRLIGNNLDRVAKQPHAARGAGEAPRVHFSEKSEDQERDVIAVIEEACRRNPAPQMSVTGAAPYRVTVRPGQLAILARTNFHLLAIEIAMIEHRIPYWRSGQGLWSDTSVQVLVSLLSSLDSGSDVGLEVALRWAKVPESMRLMLANLGGGSLVSLLSQPPAEVPGGPVVKEFVACGAKWRRQAAQQGRRRDEAIDGAITGAAGWMVAVLAKTCGMDPEDEPAPPPLKTARTMARLNVVRDILVRRRGSLAQRLMMAQQDKNKEDEMARVVLNTFHGVKGLEFEQVLLVDVVKDVVPSTTDIGEAALEEERRVFYVAMTRARDVLDIFTSRRRGVSEFLQEAGLVPRSLMGAVPEEEAA